MIDILNGLVEIEFWGFLGVTCAIIAYLYYRSVFFLLVLPAAALGLRWFIKTAIFLVRYKGPIWAACPIMPKLLISISIHIILLFALKRWAKGSPKP